MKQKSRTLCWLYLFFTVFLYAQNTENLSFEEEASSAFSINIGGRLAIGGSFFFNDVKTLKHSRPFSLIDGKLHIHAAAPMSEAYFGVRLNDKIFRNQSDNHVFPTYPQIPRWIDETFLKILFGQVVLSGGIQKINWGRAEQLSILDIINPIDKTDFTVFNQQEMKIARPILSALFYLPSDLKLEGVFLPVFEGHHIPAEQNARWYSRQFDTLLELDRNFFRKPYKTDSLLYAQGGGKLSGSINGMHDFSVQYFYGRLPEISFKTETTAGGSQSPLKVYGVYNPYHHIGLDYSVGIGAITFTTELATHITEDLAGDIPSIYNPTLLWNTGISYSAPLGFRFSITAAETIRLNHRKIGSQPYDIEKGRKATDTKLAFSLSQTLLRNSLEWNCKAIIGIEDSDFCIMPGIHWQFATVLIDCNVGVFGGNKTGMLGQFYKNSFIRLTLAYEF